MRTRARNTVGVLALLAVLTASGCAASPQPVVTRLPTDGAPSSSGSPSASRSAVPTSTPTATATPRASASPPEPVDDAIDCAGGEKTLAGSSQSFVITGDCPVLRIEGNSVSVDASDASVGMVTISGDRIRLEADAIGEATAQGNDSTIEAASARTLTVRGDRNTVSIPGGSGRVVVSGNDNVVTAPSSDVTVDGQGNSVS